LYTPEDAPVHRREITGLISNIKNLLETITEVQANSFENRRVDQLRTMCISNCGISTTVLHVALDASDEKYLETVQAGDTATTAYLNSCRLPTDRFYGIKARLINFLEENI